MQISCRGGKYDVPLEFLFRFLVAQGNVVPLGTIGKYQYIRTSSGKYNLVPAQTLKKIRKDLMISGYHYLRNTPYSDRQLLFIAYNNVTYMDNLLHTYYQHIRAETCTAAADTATSTVPITSEAHHYNNETPPYLHVTSALLQLTLSL